MIYDDLASTINLKLILAFSFTLFIAVVFVLFRFLPITILFEILRVFSNNIKKPFSNSSLYI
jgi:hypothetical protein